MLIIGLNPTHARSDPIEVEQSFKIVNQSAISARSFGLPLEIHRANLFFGHVGAAKDVEFNMDTVYYYCVNTGVLINTLRPPKDENAFAFFGLDIAPTPIGGVCVGSANSAIPKVGNGVVAIYDDAQMSDAVFLYPSDKLTHYGFGFSVETNGDLLIASVDQIMGPGGFNGRGTVIVYDLNTGMELSRISPEHLPDFSFFGARLALNGTKLFVSTSGGFLPSGVESNREFWLYDLENPHAPELLWHRTDHHFSNSGLGQSTITLTPQFAIFSDARRSDVDDSFRRVSILDTADGSMLGTIELDQNPDAQYLISPSVDAWGDLLVIGNNQADGGRAAQVYRLSTDEFIFRLTQSDSTAEDGFGFEVSIWGSQVAVSAPLASNGTASDGAVYVFELSEWIGCLPDTNSDGTLNFFDVSSFLVAFQSQDFIADFNNDGEFNFFDVSAFLTAFNAGCP